MCPPQIPDEEFLTGRANFLEVVLTSRIFGFVGERRIKTFCPLVSVPCSLDVVCYSGKHTSINVCEDGSEMAVVERLRFAAQQPSDLNFRPLDSRTRIWNRYSQRNPSEQKHVGRASSRELTPNSEWREWDIIATFLCVAPVSDG